MIRCLPGNCCSSQVTLIWHASRSIIVTAHLPRVEKVTKPSLQGAASASLRKHKPIRFAIFDLAEVSCHQLRIPYTDFGSVEIARRRKGESLLASMIPYGKVNAAELERQRSRFAQRGAPLHLGNPR